MGCKHLIPEFGRQQVDKFKASLGCTEKSCLEKKNQTLKELHPPVSGSLGQKTCTTTPRLIFSISKDFFSFSSFGKELLGWFLRYTR